MAHQLRGRCAAAAAPSSVRTYGAAAAIAKRALVSCMRWLGRVLQLGGLGHPIKNSLNGVQDVRRQEVGLIRDEGDPDLDIVLANNE